jgi:hypothetical protein
MPGQGIFTAKLPATQQKPPIAIGSYAKPKVPDRILTFMRIKSGIERSQTHSRPQVVTAAKRQRRGVARQTNPSIRPQKPRKAKSHGFAHVGNLVFGSGLLSIGTGVALLLAGKSLAGGFALGGGIVLVACVVIASQLAKEKHLRMPTIYPRGQG